MRVAIALGGTDRGLSGIGVYVRSVLPRLAAKVRDGGGSVVVLGTRADLDAYDTGDAERSQVHDGFDHPAASAAWHLLQAGPAAKRAGASVLLLPAANRRMTFFSPVPTVAVVHDLAQLKVQKKYDPLRMAYVNHVLTRTLRRATALVAPSRATRDDIVKALGVPEGSIRVVWNGVDLERFAPAAEGSPQVASARKHAGLEGPYLLYPSRLEHPGKNHIRLLRAFAVSRAATTHTLAFAGKDWGAEALIRAEIAALGLDQKVKLLGFVPDSVLPGLVAGADAMIMVGLHEGFGLPAIEAIATGRTLVASSSGALPEVVGTLAALCDPLDEKAMTQAIDRALYDSDLRDRARREGRAWAGRFGWENTAGGLFDACREVMAA
ncbi:MAG TPA: glycosyltransferase family 1 protein [Polyangiaceae bacterium]|jgi:glycosyltransferase involved in cell wall biosynthesis|nr:glycosyltransferase family 1 protein [Polyangiaceae bacterium]